MKRISHEGGFTYLALLFFVATMGIFLAATGLIWSTSQQRNKERELLYIGNEFRKAIGQYYMQSPGTVKRYPPNFEELLQDNRQLAIVRHLRRVYLDPFTGKQEWGVVRAADGGIMGIYSLATTTPVKTGGFETRNKGFETAKNYTEWRFVFIPPNQDNNIVNIIKK